MAGQMYCLPRAPRLYSLRQVLAHPLARDLELHLDDPETTGLHRKIIKSKPFLQRIYREWYGLLAESLPSGNGSVVELGSGAGFLTDFVAGVITSEVCFSPGVRVVLNGQSLPFREASLRGITMVNVLHHVPDVRALFREASRCLRSGGRVVMIEPWVSAWSRIIYTKLHHEPFEPDAQEWSLPAGGRLSAANDALPWILFERDRERWEAEFPDLSIKMVRPFMPFRYLVSGGVSMRSVMPGFAFPLWKVVERGLGPLMQKLAMFALIVVERR